MARNLGVTLAATRLRIATRKSPLALWQAEHVAQLLRSVRSDLEVTMVSSETFGDRRQDLSIPEMGGKGVFSKEIQDLVMSGRADIAVHSAKDLQAVTPPELVIGALCGRGEVRDAMIGSSLDDLPVGATVATGSNRRQALLLDRRPDVQVVGLRGNIATRLARLESEEGGPVDAIVVAAAAIDRLGLAPAVIERLDPNWFVPQVGQGALAVECKRGDRLVGELVSQIDDAETNLAVTAERAFLAELGGDCTLPAGAHAEVTTAEGEGRGPQIRVRGILARSDGSGLERAEEFGAASDDPGRILARTLRKRLEAAAPTGS